MSLQSMSDSDKACRFDDAAKLIAVRTKLVREVAQIDTALSELFLFEPGRHSFDVKAPAQAVPEPETGH